jgi:hypothetical protein
MRSLLNPALMAKKVANINGPRDRAIPAFWRGWTRDSGYPRSTTKGRDGYALATAAPVVSKQSARPSGGPRHRERYPDPGPNPLTADEEVMAVIHRPELALDEVVAGYPAHLHLDLLPRFQGRGVGER